MHKAQYCCPSAGLGLTMVAILSSTEACAPEPRACLAAVGDKYAQAGQTQILDMLASNAGLIGSIASQYRLDRRRDQGDPFLAPDIKLPWLLRRLASGP